MVSFRLIPATRHLWLFYELKKKRLNPQCSLLELKAMRSSNRHTDTAAGGQRDINWNKTIAETHKKIKVLFCETTTTTTTTTTTATATA